MILVWFTISVLGLMLMAVMLAAARLAWVNYRLRVADATLVACPCCGRPLPLLGRNGRCRFCRSLIRRVKDAYLPGFAWAQAGIYLLGYIPVIALLMHVTDVEPIREMTMLGVFLLIWLWQLYPRPI